MPTAIMKIIASIGSVNKTRKNIKEKIITTDMTTNSEEKRMTKKSNRRINELRESGKEIINDFGNEIITDNIEINELKNEIADDNEIFELQRNEIIDDKIEINELKDKAVEVENKQEIKDMEIDKNMEEQKTKEHEIKKDLEIDSKYNRYVQVKEIHVDTGDISTVYLLKVAGMDIRLYFSITEANKNARYMTKIVRRIVESGYANVNAKELVVGNKTYYVVKINGENLKIYPSTQEATRVANYMTAVTNRILKMI